MINLNFNSIKEEEHNDFLLCWDIFKSPPNRLSLHDSMYDYKSFSQRFKTDVINKKIDLFTKESDSENIKFLNKFNDEVIISFFVIEKVILNISIFYKSEKNIDYVYSLIKEMSEIIIEGEDSLLSMINIENSTIRATPIFYNLDNDFNKFYNNKTLKNISNTSKIISKNQSGLHILYGGEGRGKTSSIKIITSISNKRSFYIPNNMIEMTILNPDFINFISTYDEITIFIDDVDRIHNENYTRYISIINNIGQILDDIISNIVKVNFVLIFNEDSISDIVDDLSDKLISVVEFKNLTIDESNVLIKHLNKKKKISSETRLIDIIKTFNYDINKRIGF